MLSFQIEVTFYLNQPWMDFQTSLNLIQFKFDAMSFNIFIHMKFNFHKINSFFSLLDQLIITGSVLQHGAQVQVNKAPTTSE